MTTPWNDANAWISGEGNLSLGGGGVDDKAGSALFNYGKGDAEILIAPSELISTTLPALTQPAGAGDGAAFARTLAASTTHHVQVPISRVLQRTITSTPHGFALVSVSVTYRVNTNDLTSATLGVYSMSLLAAASLPTPAALTGTVAGNTLTHAANLYEMKFTVTTPQFFSTTGTLVWADVDIVIPGSSTCDLFGATLRGVWAAY